MKSGILVFDKKFITAAVIYFSISIFLLFKSGIQLDGEAEKFVENAHRLLNGQRFFNGIFGYFYFAFTLLVAVFLKLSINLALIGLLQICFSFFAAICLYKLLMQCLNSSSIAFLFFMVYLLCYPIQKWNFFLYSESLHTSFLVVGVYLFQKWQNDKKFINLFVLGIMLLLILFSRPVGVLFLISLIIVLMIGLYRSKSKILFYILSGISIVSIVILLNFPFSAFVNPDSIRRMEIICQVPEANHTAAYQEYNREGLYKALTVIKNEIGFRNFFKTGLKKLGYFFGMYRNYYSWQHNLLLICFTVFYPLASIAVFSEPAKSFYYARLFAIIYLLFTSAGIFFTCDEWSNRFVSPAFPYILILAAGGFLKVSAYLKKKASGI